MLEHAGKLSIRERFETKIAESSQKAIKLEKKVDIGKNQRKSYFNKAKTQPLKAFLDAPRPL